jgi:flagellar hook-basal body complex protein FliE
MVNVVDSGLGGVLKSYKNALSLSSETKGDEGFKEVMSLLRDTADKVKASDRTTMEFASGQGGDMGDAAIEAAITAVSVEGVQAVVQKLINLHNELIKMSV